MRRIVITMLALAANALRVPCIPLAVQSSDDLWPEWQRLVSVSPLPAGTEVIHLPEGSQPFEDSAVLSMGGDGKIVARMPLVPVVRLGDERASATRAEVERGTVAIQPLCSVSLPDTALPLDDMLPDQPGYAVSRDVTLRLNSSDARLRAWFSKLPPAPLRPAIAWIEAVGDLMPARGVDDALLRKGGLERVFGDALGILRGGNLLIGNLESSASLGGVAEQKSYTFRFRSEAVGKLKEAGFSYLSLANNHTFDFGADGFLQTLAALSRWGVSTSGAGANLQDAGRPAVMTAGPLEVRILSFGAFPVDRTGFDGQAVERARDSLPGILWLDEQGLQTSARAFAAGIPGGAASFNIAFVHGGEEWSITPTAEQRRLYRELVRHGADLVIGAHPHVLEGMEAFDGRLIAYSLGNFLFPGMEGTPGGEDSVILRLGVYDGKVRYVQAFPVRLSGGTVSLADNREAWQELMSRTRALKSAQPAEGWQKTARELF